MLGVLVICSWCRVMGFVYHSRQNPMTCWRTLQIPFGLSPWRTFALGIRVFGVLWCAFACTRIVPFCCGSRGWKLYPVRMFLHAYSTHMISRKRCRNRSSLWWLRILSDSDYSLYFFFSFLYFFLFDHRKVTTGVERWTVGPKKSNSVACLCVTAGSKCSEAISSFFCWWSCFRKQMIGLSARPTVQPYPVMINSHGRKIDLSSWWREKWLLSLYVNTEDLIIPCIWRRAAYVLSQ